jgi:hypothetical protein
MTIIREFFLDSRFISGRALKTLPTSSFDPKPSASGQAVITGTITVGYSL